MPGEPRRVVALGEHRAELELARERFRGLAELELETLCWPDGPGLSRALERPVALLLAVALGHHAELGPLLARRGKAPLVACGPAAPPASWSPTAWFPELPGLTLLRALMPPGEGALEESSAHGLTWRRKSDMIIGDSPAMSQLLHTLNRLSGAAAPVLVQGESGTGKELVARSLHYCGPRRALPFLAVNCAALPETLFESELFGHTRGAFTGAVANRAGVFEAAGEGTVFLDEIGELPLALQPKLLRVIESGEVTPLGATEARRCSARLVFATNRDLEREVTEGRLRPDLFYRIQGFRLLLPPLRSRPEDIPALVAHHLGELAKREGVPVPAVSRAALDRLVAHRWPGNVRELINVLQRGVLTATEGVIDEQHLELPRNAARTTTGYQEAKAEFERQYYTRLMRMAGGNVSQAAALAEKTRKEIYDALKRIGLSAEEFRSTIKSSG